jgi:DivIVA domain-containing protein
VTWLFAVVVVALMGVVAVVATGRGGSMAEARPDRPDVLLAGTDRPLTAHDLREVRFSTALRGYRMEEVDALLDRLVAELETARERRGDPGRG